MILHFWVSANLFETNFSMSLWIYSIREERSWLRYFPVLITSLKIKGWRRFGSQLLACLFLLLFKRSIRVHDIEIIPLHFLPFKECRPLSISQLPRKLSLPETVVSVESRVFSFFVLFFQSLFQLLNCLLKLLLCLYLENLSFLIPIVLSWLKRFLIKTDT